MQKEIFFVKKTIVFNSKKRIFVFLRTKKLRPLKFNNVFGTRWRFSLWLSWDSPKKEGKKIHKLFLSLHRILIFVWDSNQNFAWTCMLTRDVINLFTVTFKKFPVDFLGYFLRGWDRFYFFSLRFVFRIHDFFLDCSFLIIRLFFVRGLQTTNRFTNVRTWLTLWYYYRETMGPMLEFWKLNRMFVVYNRSWFVLSSNETHKKANDSRIGNTAAI